MKIISPYISSKVHTGNLLSVALSSQSPPKSECPRTEKKFFKKSRFNSTPINNYKSNWTISKIENMKFPT